MPTKRRSTAPRGDLARDILRSEGELIPRDYLTKVLQGRAEGQAATGAAERRAAQKQIATGFATARSAWQRLQATQASGRADRAAVVSFVTDLLRGGLGFDSLEPVPSGAADADELPLGYRALSGRVPVVIADEDGLDVKSPAHGRRAGRGIKASKRSPFGLLQAYLNRHEEALWGLACDGHHLRLARDHAALTGIAYIDADLDRVFGASDPAAFANIWLLMHQSRFGARDTPAAACALESWREAGLSAGMRARDRLRDGVARAIAAMGTGMLSHPANTSLRDALAKGQLTPADLRRDLLRTTYRLIFLITSETRGLLHPPDSSDAARELYARSFALRPLCERAASGQGRDAHGDAWEAVRRVFVALAAGEPRLALPALGAMFAPGHCGELDACALANADFLAALDSLTWMTETHGRVPVSWADIGAEERGSIYEGLLDQEPRVVENGRRFVLTAGGTERKTVAAYYTPSTLVESLLDTALEPAIREAIGTRDADAGTRLLSLRVIDPACGSGNFLLAATRRIARHLVDLEGGDPASTYDARHAMRRVVSRCIYGADRDGRVLDLVRFGLWLEVCVPDLPLPFLDHHLHAGDSIVGVSTLEMLAAGIPDDAYKPLSGDDANTCTTLRARNRDERRALTDDLTQAEVELAALAERLAAVETMLDETPAAVEEKRRAWVATAAALATAPIALACDVLVRSYMAPKIAGGAADVPTSTAMQHALAGAATADPSLPITSVKDGVSAPPSPWTHWPVRFAHVLRDGGFDVVLANPPWERLALKDKEYFAARDAQVANAANAAAAKRRIAALQAAAPGTAERDLYGSYLRAKREADAACAFARHPTRFPLAGHGTANTYPLFIETALAIRKPSGRSGLIVPSNLGTDTSTRHLFQYLTAGRLASFYDFENTHGIFPAIDSRMRFTLATLAPSPTTEYAFYLHATTDLMERSHIVTLTARDLAIFNPNTCTVPCFRSRRDLDIARRIYDRVPVMRNKKRPHAHEDGIGFGAMFHMAMDSKSFHTRATKHRIASPIPLYEAKMIHQFDPQWATFGADEKFHNIKEEDKSSHQYPVQPHYWLERHLLDAKLTGFQWSHHWLIGLRDIASPTNLRTAIASFLPCTGVGNSLNILQRARDLDITRAAALTANLNSLVFDFLARQKSGGLHLNLFVVEQLPILPLSGYDPSMLAFVSIAVGQLYAGSGLPAIEALAPDTPGRLDPATRARCRAELDAFYAAAYGLDRRDLAFILDPQNEAQPGGPPHPSETFRVLRDQEQKLYGEYRTQRLVLEAWDRMEREGTLPPPYTP